jgi:hypothetical protein
MNNKPVIIIGLPTIRELMNGNSIELENAYLMPDSVLENESRQKVDVINTEWIKAGEKYDYPGESQGDPYKSICAGPPPAFHTDSHPDNSFPNLI